MRILQLGKFYPIRGGVEKVMLDITQGLSNRGYKCDMLCAYLTKKKIDNEIGGKAFRDGRNFIIELNDSGRVICVPAINKIAATMISPAMISWLRKHKDEYELICVHHPDPMACMALWASGYKGRVIVHWHSDILKQKVLLSLYRPFQNWLLRKAEKIIGTTPVYVEKSPHLKHFHEKTTFVPIGIKPVIFDEEKAEEIKRINAGKKIIFSLGRLVGYKGFEYLIDAATFLDENYHIVIAGAGELEGILKRRIEEKKLAGRVSLTGYISNKEAKAYFGACDVFVMSSVMKTEAFGIVQIESMSCGKPVVSTRIPDSGVDWVNKHQESGITVPIKDAKAIADAVIELTSDEKKYSSYCNRARQRFLDMFTNEVMIDKLIKKYSC